MPDLTPTLWARPLMPRYLLLQALALAAALLASAPAAAVPTESDPARLVCSVALEAASLRDVLPATLKGDARAFTDTQAGAARLVGLLADQPAVETRIRRHADQLLARQEVVQKAATALLAIAQQADPLLETVEAVYSAELSAASSAARQAAANQLGMLSQRLGKSAVELVASGSLSAEAVFRLGKDTQSFQRLLTGLSTGDAELRLPPARSAAAKSQVAAVEREFRSLKTNVGLVLGTLKDLVAAWEAQALLTKDLLALGRQTAALCVPPQP